jgi:hypothetical protein
MCQIRRPQFLSIPEPHGEFGEMSTALPHAPDQELRLPYIALQPRFSRSLYG